MDGAAIISNHARSNPEALTLAIHYAGAGEHPGEVLKNVAMA